MRQDVSSRVWELVQGARVRTEEVGGGITHLRITSRWARMLGFDVSAYLVGSLLVDTGFAHVRRRVLGVLDGTRIAAVCCTHSHEDHTGNCGAVSAIHGCPVYLRNADRRWDEGVSRLKPYRAWWWGPSWPYDAEEMPEQISDGARTLTALPASGHSETHVALWEEATGTVFTGDLFIAPGAAAVMTHENPYELAASLRRVAAAEPRLMLTGHGLAISDPVPRLLAKADRIETAAAEAVRLRRQGLGDRTIVRRVFPRGNLKDRLLEGLTQGEFARVNFVRAAVRHDRSGVECPG